ncbi:MAG TPA: hypothetical protein DEV93_11885 [Chloroflexi bacterium]|nr:hypothetical protein [Chloroflexota bacterium]
MQRFAALRPVRDAFAACTLITAIWLPPLAARATASHPCPRIASHFSSGTLPHEIIALYSDRQNRRHPIATDGSHVLMGWETSREPGGGGPVHLWTMRLPSTKLMPIPRSAYPPRTFLAGWQLEWPWIVGIAYTTPPPTIPADWRLWAGNVVTGMHFILDTYRNHRHPVPEFFPRFALNAGRVAWEFSIDRPARFDTFSSQRIALEDLKSRHRTFLTAPDPLAVYGRITMSGHRIVWESQRFGTSGKSVPVDLSMYDLSSHRLSQLSHNASPNSSSLYPRLSGRYLLFEQGEFGSDGGIPYLVDLSSRKGSATRRWFSKYRFWRLGKGGLTNTQLGNGLISWGDGRILDVTRGKIWTFGFRSWRVDAIAGRTVLVERIDPTNGHVSYAAWRFPEACSASGF